MVKRKETTDRAKEWKCVRFDDKKGFRTKFNKTNFPNESGREMYYYFVKYVEQLARRCSPTSVAERKRFQEFQMFSEDLKLKALPEDYQSFSHMEKRETVEKLVDELAAAMSHGPVQDANTQADYPAAMQVGEGCGPDPAWEGIANTSFPPDDSLQNVPLGGVPSVRLPGVPRGFTHDLGSFTLSQLDNPAGRPPPSFRQYPDELNQSMSETEWRASRYLDREMNDEDPQNQLRKTSMEDAGSQDGEDLRNRSISEALEVVPRFTGRNRKNVGDICPEVNGGSADGDLPSKPIMESIDMQNNNPRRNQFDEVRAAAPNPDFGYTLLNDASLQNVACSQCDNRVGRSPSRSPVPLELVVSFMNELMDRASVFPGMLPKLEWSEATFRSFNSKLEFLEDALQSDSNNNSKSHQEELYPPAEHFSAYEAVTNMPSMESSADFTWCDSLFVEPPIPDQDQGLFGNL